MLPESGGTYCKLLTCLSIAAGDCLEDMVQVCSMSGQIVHILAVWFQPIVTACTMHGVDAAEWTLTGAALTGESQGRSTCTVASAGSDGIGHSLSGA